MREKREMNGKELLEMQSQLAIIVAESEIAYELECIEHRDAGDLSVMIERFLEE